MSNLMKFDVAKSATQLARELEPGLYGGFTDDGLHVQFLLASDGTSELRTEQVGKPNWMEVQYYDENGMLEGDGVTFVGERK